MGAPQAATRPTPPAPHAAADNTAYNASFDAEYAPLEEEELDALVKNMPSSSIAPGSIPPPPSAAMLASAVQALPQPPAADIPYNASFDAEFAPLEEELFPSDSDGDEVSRPAPTPAPQASISALTPVPGAKDKAFQYADESGKVMTVSLAEKADVVTFTFKQAGGGTGAARAGAVTSTTLAPSGGRVFGFRSTVPRGKLAPARGGRVIVRSTPNDKSTASFNVSFDAELAPLEEEELDRIVSNMPAVAQKGPPAYKSTSFNASFDAESAPLEAEELDRIVNNMPAMGRSSPMEVASNRVPAPVRVPEAEGVAYNASFDAEYAPLEEEPLEQLESNMAAATPAAKGQRNPVDVPEADGAAYNASFDAEYAPLEEEPEESMDSPGAGGMRSMRVMAARLGVGQEARVPPMVDVDAEPPPLAGMGTQGNLEFVEVGGWAWWGGVGVRRGRGGLLGGGGVGREGWEGREGKEVGRRGEGGEGSMVCGVLWVGRGGVGWRGRRSVGKEALGDPMA